MRPRDVVGSSFPHLPKDNENVTFRLLSPPKMCQKKTSQVYKFTHYDYGVWISSIVWFQDRDKLISHKGNKSLPAYRPCSCTTELNALLSGDNNGRYPRAPRSWNWSLNSSSCWTSSLIPCKSSPLQLNAITSVIHLFFVVHFVEIDNRYCQCLT